MAKEKTVYICNECGYKSVKWLGRCTSCGTFNSFSEEIVRKINNKTISKSSLINNLTKLDEVSSIDNSKTATNIGELDRVLSGGFVKGSLTLFGGNPGIGKSTLILQLCESVAKKGEEVIYVSGEESIQQIKLRADRLGASSENISLLSETNIDIITDIVNKEKPNFLIIDSIQTMYSDDVSSSQGSVSQTRECVNKLMVIGKKMNITVLIIGHVTKDGAIAGPKILEHMVDTVIYFEGDRYASYRIIRSIKNRFGSTNEIGVFEMEEKGLKEIKNPSEFMLSGRPTGVSGSVITCTIEGTRALLSEVQGLVSFTKFGQPRRTATGMDYNRVVMLIAVLEKRCNLDLSEYDSYVNIAGGMRILEPALDAAVITAIVSSYKNIAMDSNTVVFGEVGLAGEIRGIILPENRIEEAIKMGFKKCILPESNVKNSHRFKNIEIIGVSNVRELLIAALGNKGSK
ncbi:MAG: DNA repair protein RadA [Lachnospirales bacterium]